MGTEGLELTRNRPERRLLQISPGAVVAILAAIVLVLLGGCSLVGWRIGASADAKKPDSIRVQSWQLETIPSGRKLALYLVDGSVVTGLFQRVEQDSIAAYHNRYASFATALTAPTGFPAPGDSVTVRRSGGTMTGARLVGYDFNRVVVQPDQGQSLTLQAHEAARIEWQGQAIAPFPLMSWLQYSRVPLLSSMLIKQSTPTSRSAAATRGWPGEDKDNKTVQRRVPISDIVQIQYANVKHGARNGFLAGLAVDAAIVVAVIATQGDDEPPPPPPPPPPPGGGGGSCPLIYSYDGRTHVLDAEAFSGAILKQLQQADYARLDHLEAVDGVCRIMVANRLPETHYVDQLELIAVDHPRGVEVLPEGPGQWRTISDPQRPLAVTDYAGSIVTRLVADRDSLDWISNPLGRDTGDGGGPRDGLVLRFARPTRAHRPKLVLTLRNTPWLTELEHRLMELPGAMLGLWSAQMNASAVDRQVLTDALQREIGLRAELWDGKTWRPVTCLPFVGPFVSRSIVLSLDLADIRTEEVRIRIESAPGMWMVDCVEADFSQDLPVFASSMDASTAVDGTGRDIRRQLAGVDGDYLRLEAGDDADVRFVVKPPRPGLERSYVILCNGYYTIHVDARGFPQLALMRELAREPGAGSAYATGVVNRWIAQELSPSQGANSGEQN